MDRELVERARHGDRAAFETLARASCNRLYAIAYRILRDADQADDAVQRSLVAIWRDLPKLRDVDRYDAWTYRLVVRFAVAEARRETARRTRTNALSCNSYVVLDAFGGAPPEFVPVPGQIPTDTIVSWGPEP